MKAIVVEQVGGPEQLQIKDIPIPQPGPGQALVRVAASGVNYIDVYFRTGLYPAPTPLTPGMEAAGTVVAVAPDVESVTVGDKVAYAMARGSYAEYAAVPAWQLIKVPSGLDLLKAAGSMLQGMTAHYLTHSTFEVKQGQTVLIHAAAGGTGLWLVQMAKLRGAHVIGTVGTEDKAELARQNGADDVILYKDQDFVAEVKRITSNRGVEVVYDSVGASTFEKSLDCLRPRGMLVTFGNASGPVPPVAPLVLSQKGSLFLTRPTLANYTATREELLWRANDVLQGVQSGSLNLHIGATYPLEKVADAHRDLESRKTSGKLLLTV